jgi:hypothetical protein
MALLPEAGVVEAEVVGSASGAFMSTRVAKMVYSNRSRFFSSNCMPSAGKSGLVAGILVQAVHEVSENHCVHPQRIPAASSDRA